MHDFAAKTHSLRIVLLVVVTLMMVGWLTALCETHEEDCHECCTCALPCCQVAVLTIHPTPESDLEVNGTLSAVCETAIIHSTSPVFRPPKA